MKAPVIQLQSDGPARGSLPLAARSESLLDRVDTGLHIQQELDLGTA
jgi:hypothetical protein